MFATGSGSGSSSSSMWRPLAIGQNPFVPSDSLAYWGICINTFAGLCNFLGQVQAGSVTLWLSQTLIVLVLRATQSGTQRGFTLGIGFGIRFGLPWEPRPAAELLQRPTMLCAISWVHLIMLLIICMFSSAPRGDALRKILKYISLKKYEVFYLESIVKKKHFFWEFFLKIFKRLKW